METTRYSHCFATLKFVIFLPRQHFSTTCSVNVFVAGVVQQATEQNQGKMESCLLAVLSTGVCEKALINHHILLRNSFYVQDQDQSLLYAVAKFSRCHYDSFSFVNWDAESVG